MSVKPKWMGLFSWLGTDKVESTADGVFMKDGEVDKLTQLQADHEALKTSSADFPGKIAQLETDLNTAKEATTIALDAKKKAEDDLVAAQAIMQTKEDEITDLKAQLTNKPVNRRKTITKTGDGGTPEDGETNWDEINALSHNQYADKILGKR